MIILKNQLLDYSKFQILKETLRGLNQHLLTNWLETNINHF